MSESFKDKAERAGHKISESATAVGHKVGEKVEEASDWAKEKAHQVGNRIGEAAHKVENKARETFGETSSSWTLADVRKHMDVVGSCGNTLGKVDGVEGDQIKLTKNDSPDGQHHLIPTSWVLRVDQSVHLSKNLWRGQARVAAGLSLDRHD